MRYLAFVGTEGRNQPEIVEEMNRDWPAYEAELAQRLPWRAGRELDLPERGVKVVTVRDGSTLITDGPFAATKEFIAGLDIFQCASREEAIELEGKSPVARYLPFELRELPDGFKVGAALAAFGDWDDSAGIPFLLATWVDGELSDDGKAYPAWQDQLEQQGTFVFGGTISGPGSAVTLRTVDGELRATPGSFIDADPYVAAVDVVRAPDWDTAIAIAEGHPLAQHHAIEARSFYSEAALASSSSR